MKRAVIFLHGNKPNNDDIKKSVKKTDFIICADGGTQYALEAGLTPSIVLGDFDSLSTKFQEQLKKRRIPLEKFPKEKDFTDSELAINYAIKKGSRDLLFFGFFGTRIDHFIANLTYLAKLSEEGVKIKIIDNFQTLYLTSYAIDIKGKKKDFLSLISLKKDAEDVSVTGLKYRLYNETLFYGATRAVSNEFVSSKIHISVGKGTLLVIHSKFNH